jgi:hypothetical protein
MGPVAADIIQVIVFARYAHAFLRVGGSLVGTYIRSEKDVFKLHHPSIGEQQGLIAAWHKRGGWHNGMAMFEEKVNKILADL